MLAAVSDRTQPTTPGPLSIDRKRASTPRVRRAAVWLVALIVVAPALAHGWPRSLHEAVVARSLEGRVKHGSVVLPEPADVVGFYRWLGLALAGAVLPDPGGKERFLRLYPHERSFDAIGVRRFLGLTVDPTVTVHGVGAFDSDRELDRFDIIAFAAAKQHEDHRHVGRAQRDGKHALLHLAGGSPLPDDPQTLHFGPLEGPGSDEWAQSALPAALTTTDASVLASEPWRFVAPVSAGVEVAGGATRMAQLHLDMSIMGLGWGGIELKAAGEYFGLVWVGAAMGIALDAASPFAAVQAGSNNLWDAAGRAWWAIALRTGGGLWGVLPTRAWLAARIRHNLRVLGEVLVARALDDALDGVGDQAAKDAIAMLGTEDEAFVQSLLHHGGKWLKMDGKADPWVDGHGPATEIVAALAEAATEDGARAYDLAASIAAPRWLTGEELLDLEHVDVALLLRDPNDPATELARRELLAITGRALRRATTATRMMWAIWETADGRSSLGRLRQGGLAHLDARIARAAPWQPDGEAPEGGWGAEKALWVGVLEILAAIVCLFALGASIRRRQRR